MLESTQGSAFVRMLSQDNNDLCTPLLETEVGSLGHLEAHHAFVSVRGRRTNGDPLTNLHDSMIGLQKLGHSAPADTLLSCRVMTGGVENGGCLPRKRACSEIEPAPAKSLAHGPVWP